MKVRRLAAAREHPPTRDPCGVRAYSRSISTRGSLLASGAGGTGGPDFTGTSGGAGLTTGAFAAFFASRARRARGSSISLGREKRGCQIPVGSGAPRRPAEAHHPPLTWAPHPPPPEQRLLHHSYLQRGRGDRLGQQHQENQ